MDTEQGASVLGETFIAFTTEDGDAVQLLGYVSADGTTRVGVQIRDADDGRVNIAQLDISETKRLALMFGAAVEWAERRVGLNEAEQARLYAEEAEERRRRTDAMLAQAAEDRRRREQDEFASRIERFREHVGGSES